MIFEPQDSGGPQGKEGRGGGFGFCFKQSRCLFRGSFLEKGALPLEGKKGHRPWMGLLFAGAERLFFTTRRMRAV